VKISDAAKKIHKCAQEKGWWDYKPQSNATDFSNGHIATKLLLATGELSEAFEEIRAGKRPDEIYYKDSKETGTKKPEGVPIEIADCIIRLLDLCEYWNIDIEKALEVKMAFNEQRPYKHGGKVC